MLMGYSYVIFMVALVMGLSSLSPLKAGFENEDPDELHFLIRQIGPAPSSLPKEPQPCPDNVDLWFLISARLENENDVARLGKVCALTRSVINHPTAKAWEGVANKYEIQPHQVHRFLEIFREYKGQERVRVESASSFSPLNSEYVKQHSCPREPMVLTGLTDFFAMGEHYYWLNSLEFTPAKFAKLKVEEEERAPYFFNISSIIWFSQQVKWWSLLERFQNLISNPRAAPRALEYKDESEGEKEERKKHQ